MRRDWGLGIWNLEGRLRLIKTLCCIFHIKNLTSRISRFTFDLSQLTTPTHDSRLTTIPQSFPRRRRFGSRLDC